MKKIKISGVILHIAIILGALVSLFPFYWLFVMATRTSAEFLRFPPVLIPGGNFMVNARNLVSQIDFWLVMGNTFFVSAVKTVGALFFCSVAAFYFAKFEFPFKKGLFAALLLTMMIPTQLSYIPLLIMMNKLQWAGTFKALIMPTLIPAFGVFWIRQYTTGAIHNDLINSGRIDGCGTFRLYYSIGLPIMVPGLSFLAIYTFMTTWNDYLWPLIVTNDPRKYTVQVALQQLNGVFNRVDYGMVMCGTLLATLPLVIIFLIFNKQFTADIAAGAIKD